MYTVCRGYGSTYVKDTRLYYLRLGSKGESMGLLIDFFLWCFFGGLTPLAKNKSRGSEVTPSPWLVRLVSLPSCLCAWLLWLQASSTLTLKMSIPVVDFSPYNLGVAVVLDEHIVDLAEQLKSSFTQVGFVYLENTGITQEEV